MSDKKKQTELMVIEPPYTPKKFAGKYAHDKEDQYKNENPKTIAFNAYLQGFVDCLYQKDYENAEVK